MKPTKLVRGKGVAKLLANGGILEETHAAEPEEHICVTIEAMKKQGWYKLHRLDWVGRMQMG